MMLNARNLTAALLLLVVPFTLWAQDDDLYFVPKKKAKTAKTEQATAQPATRYRNVQIIYADDETDDGTAGISGSRRDVDEYNRRGSYRLPANDTLYIMDDTTAITTRQLAGDAYAQGYDEGYADGEDYAVSRRLGRFGYGSVYASPWYYSYYDPFYYDYYDPWWGWGGYYGWHRPYWGYTWGWGYNPYWYGSWGYYGWHRPYYGGYWGGGRGYHHGYVARGHNPRQPGYTGRSGNYARGGRSSGNSRMSGTRSGVNYREGRSSVSSRSVGRSSGNSSYGRSATNTSRSTTNTSRSTTNTSRSSSTYSGSTSRSSGSSGSSGFGAGRSSGGGGGFSGGGGGGRSGGGSRGGR